MKRWFSLFYHESMGTDTDNDFTRCISNDDDFPAECECGEFGCMVLANEEENGEDSGEWKPECKGCILGKLEITDDRDALKMECKGSSASGKPKMICRNKAITRGYDSCELGDKEGKGKFFNI